MSNRSELLERAARCYHSAGAGWMDDAVRCYEAVQDFASAARLHEQAGRWLRAAECFVRASLWPSAGHAYLEAGEPGEAADALLRGGEKGEAAWILADQCRLFTRARSVARELPDSPATLAERDLILARCEIGLNRPDAAARTLRGALRHLEAVGAIFGRERLDIRALRIADLLRRPDLAALIHAASARAGTHLAAEHWREWADGELGDAAGVPLAEDLRSRRELAASKVVEEKAGIEGLSNG
jgi:tetratricopeptide (TPR) repeat protein